MRTTTLDFSILGLLLSGPKTAYAIRMIFKTTAMGNYSSSPGSIYPATHKLRKLGLIVSDTDEGGLLHITEEGKQQMKDWLNEPISIEMIAKESNILILKFAFMDHLVSQEEKVTFLKSFEEQSKAYFRSLEDYHRSTGPHLPLHGRLAFEYGLASMKTQLSWIRSSLKTILSNS